MSAAIMALQDRAIDHHHIQAAAIRGQDQGGGKVVELHCGQVVTAEHAHRLRLWARGRWVCRTGSGR